MINSIGAIPRIESKIIPGSKSFQMENDHVHKCPNSGVKGFYFVEFSHL